MAGNFRIEDYVDVAERIREFKAAYPDGTLQPLDHENPYIVQEIDGQTLIVYRAAAFRTPDDPRPGIGVASEPYPGRTPYTKGSEIQNAETSAWGRAIVALGIPTKRIASADEVKPRMAEREEETSEPEVQGISQAQARSIHEALHAKGHETAWFLERLSSRGVGDGAHLSSIPAELYERVLASIGQLEDAVAPAAAPALPAQEDPQADDESDLSDGERQFLKATERPPADAMPEPTGKVGTVTAPQLTRLGALCSDLEAEGVGREEWRRRMHDAEGVISRKELTKTAAVRVIDAFNRWLTDVRTGVVGAAE